MKTPSRVQLALNVSDIESSVEFYEKLFNTPVSKRKPGYANFSIENPPLKLVLIEEKNESEKLNHLGIEVATTQQVQDATVNLQQNELPVHEEENTTCCYALQDKVWTSDPDGAPWEVYVVKEHVESNTALEEGKSMCCTPSDAVFIPVKSTLRDVEQSDGTVKQSGCC